MSIEAPRAETVNVATVASEKFKYGTAVLIASAARACTAEHVRFFLLDMGLKPASRDALRETVRRCGRTASLDFLDPNPSDTYRAIMAIMRKGYSGVWHPFFFAKLAIPELIADRCDRVLYLDSDIYCALDLSAAAATLDRHPACAVLDGPVTADGYGAEFEIAGLDGTAPYFNGGFIGLDVAYWMAHRLYEPAVALTDRVTAAVPEKRVAFSDRAQELIARHGWKFSDQAVFNILFHRNWEILPVDWNTQSPFAHGGFMEIAAGKRCNLHYVTNPKPWQVPVDKTTALFFEALDLTAFRGWRPNPIYWATHRALRTMKYRASVYLRKGRA